AIFDFELTEADKEEIAGLNQGESQFFSHADPEMVKWMASRKLNV
ncbi:aldo/keto reductase, partial [Escherichia coli]|nr:aldo/keto reductase [Escherichia coli]